ncbi:MAG TPA: class I SAM-dependent methyltransferase [Urbifossiella sp.]|nr:class I SAM-dependent methyltransferase [Urbifossiella sp.]
MSADLFRGWELYDRITRANHMRHAETEAGVRAALARRAGPLRVLDLGCGDGRVAADVLAWSRVVGYVGVDLSAGALDLHARRPVPGSCPGEVARRLVCGDIAEVIVALPDGAFDLVLAGFSLHHFPTDRKAGILDDIARVLAPDGWFIWTDTYRREGESRDAFLARLFVEVRTTWVAATPDEREQFVAHIGEFDHPEPLSWMTAQLAARGLARAEVLYRDEFYVSLIGSRGL